MKFNTNKRKISKLEDQTRQNDIDLTKKSNQREDIIIPNYTFKAPKVLSDTGWFPLNILEGNIITEISPMSNTRAYGWIDHNGTYLEGQETVSSVYVWFNEVLDVPAHLLPFVNYSLMVKNSPDYEVFQHYKKWYAVPRKADYFHITAGGSLLYKGFDYDSNPYTEDEYDYLNESYTTPGWIAYIHDNPSDSNRGGIVNGIWGETVTDDYGVQWTTSNAGGGAPYTKQSVKNYTSYILYGGIETMTQSSATGFGSKTVVHWTHVENHPTDGQPVYYRDTFTTTQEENLTSPIDSIQVGNAKATSEFTSSDFTWRTDITPNPNGSLSKLLYYSTQKKSRYTRVVPNDEFFYDGLDRDYIPGEDTFPYDWTSELSVTFEKNQSVPEPNIPDDLKVAHMESGDTQLGNHRAPHFTRVYQSEDDGSEEIKTLPGKHILWTLDVFDIKAIATKNVGRQYTWQYDTYQGPNTYDTDEESRSIPHYVPNIDFQVRLIVTLNAPLYYHEVKKFREKL